jgi:hypothetical protein
MLDERVVDVFHGVDADYGIELSVDITRHDRDHPAPHANVELGCLGSEDIPRDARRIGN